MKKLILILLTTTITAFAQDAHPLRYSLQYLSLPKDEVEEYSISRNT
jgi:hypothetical protein